MKVLQLWSKRLYVLALKSPLFYVSTYSNISSNVFYVSPNSKVLIGVPYYVWDGLSLFIPPVTN